MRFALIGLTLLLSTSASLQASTLPFETISHGIASGYESEATLVIRDSAAWTSLWQSHASLYGEPPPLPDVDFSREMVIAAMMGRKPTCGYMIHITDISVEDGTLHVNITRVSPPQKDLEYVCLAETSPYHIVKTERFDGTVVTQATDTNTPPASPAPEPTSIFPPAILTSIVLGVAIALARRARR